MRRRLLVCLLTVLISLFTSCSSNVNGSIENSERIEITDNTRESGLISKSEAIEIAKKYDTNTAKSWEALFENDKEIKLNNESKIFDVWTVTATYQFGNQMIVEINANNGEILVLTEVEANK